MSYQVFARKYRPRTFKDVLGQDHVVRTLCNAIEQKRLAHAYLFVGPRGTGKTSTARIFAKALNCTGGPKVDFDPDEEVCIEIAEGRNLDVQEIDGASNRGIDNIRDLRDYVQFAPSRGNYRIVYIDEVHMLTKESFNALLKTLEEPPPHVMFIFATTEPHKILPTILSRCQRFDLRPIPTDIIANHLVNIAANEGVTLTQGAAYAIATVAEGGMRDAQSMLDQLVSFCGNHIDEQNVNDIFGVTGRETVCRALVYILGRQLPDLLHLVHELAEAGRDMGQLLSELMGAVRELLIAKVAPQEASASIPEQWKETLNTLLARTPTDKIIRLMEVLSHSEEQMRHSSNKRLYLEMGLIQAVHSLAEANISDIIRALNGAPLPESSVAVAAMPPMDMPQQPMPVAPQPAPMPAPQPAPAPMPEPEPSPVIENPVMPPGLEQLDDPPPLFDVPADEQVIESARPVTPEDWDAIVDFARESSPINGSMLGATMFIADEDGLLTIAIHPEDVDTRDALLSENIIDSIREQALARCKREVSIKIITDAAVAPPTPVEILPPPNYEEVLPAPAPKPAPKEAPKPQAPEKRPAPPSLKPTMEEFYQDPLIELALKEFHATLIK